mmetsp:Transcript_3557/g.13127  ORF Transcript_3557/g.13127 Transcript_3557/m.13127 type:complete len:449 (-) Transcript_3557:513-1859(-)
MSAHISPTEAFRARHATPYAGARDAHAFTAFAADASGPPAASITARVAANSTPPLGVAPVRGQRRDASASRSATPSTNPLAAISFVKSEATSAARGARFSSPLFALAPSSANAAPEPLAGSLGSHACSASAWASNPNKGGPPDSELLRIAVPDTSASIGHARTAPSLPSDHSAPSHTAMEATPPATSTELTNFTLWPFPAPVPLAPDTSSRRYTESFEVIGGLFLLFPESHGAVSSASRVATARNPSATCITHATRVPLSVSPPPSASPPKTATAVGRDAPKIATGRCGAVRSHTCTWQSSLNTVSRIGDSLVSRGIIFTPRIASLELPPGCVGPAMAFHNRASVAGLSSAARSSDCESSTATRPLCPPIATQRVPTAHIAVGPSNCAIEADISLDVTSDALSATSAASLPVPTPALRRVAAENDGTLIWCATPVTSNTTTTAATSES